MDLPTTTDSTCDCVRPAIHRSLCLSSRIFLLEIIWRLSCSRRLIMVLIVEYTFMDFYLPASKLVFYDTTELFCIFSDQNFIDFILCIS